MKTVRDEIRERFPEHYQRICEIIHAYNVGDLLLDHAPMSGGLKGWFTWRSTSEGHEYWSALHEGDEARRESAS